MPPTKTSLPSADPSEAGLVLTLDLTAGRLLLAGELDRATCGQLVPACDAVSAASARVWVLDVAGLSFCDTAGLRALDSVRGAAADAGGAVILSGARPFLRRLLALAGARTPAFLNRARARPERAGRAGLPARGEPHAARRA